MFYLKFQISQLPLCTHQFNHLATTKMSPFFVAEISKRKKEFLKLLMLMHGSFQNRPFKIPLESYKNSSGKQQEEETEMKALSMANQEAYPIMNIVQKKS